MTLAFEEDLHLLEVELCCATELLHEVCSGSSEGYQAVVAVVEEMPVGYAMFGEVPLTSGTYDLYWIAVSPSMQGGGVGRVLMENIEALISALDARLILVETSGRSDYSHTRAFYVGCGYQIMSVIPHFYAPNDSRVIFGKYLDEHALELNNY